VFVIDSLRLMERSWLIFQMKLKDSSILPMTLIIGFENLSEATNTPSKSLMRMFSQKGNPLAKKLFAVISHLQSHSGIHFEVRSVK